MQRAGSSRPRKQDAHSREAGTCSVVRLASSGNKKSIACMFGFAYGASAAALALVLARPPPLSPFFSASSCSHALFARAFLNLLALPVQFLLADSVFFAVCYSAVACWTLWILVSAPTTCLPGKTKRAVAEAAGAGKPSPPARHRLCWLLLDAQARSFRTPRCCCCCCLSPSSSGGWQSMMKVMRGISGQSMMKVT